MTVEQAKQIIKELQIKASLTPDEKARLELAIRVAAGKWV